MKIILITVLLLFGCNDISNTNNPFNNENNLNNLIDAYVFLADNHDLLHIMMGEYEGSAIDSYILYKNKIAPFKENIYLQPILFGLDKIAINDNKLLENADKFDALVDYYQIGMQMMIEGILKGYGYIDKMPQNSKEYLDIKSIDFNKN